MRSLLAYYVVLSCMILACEFPRSVAGQESKAAKEGAAPEIPDTPYETQTAQCTITSGDIEASAQASISKTLVGVCGTDEMLTAFRTLEAKLLDELQNIRKMIRDPYFNPPPLQPSVYRSVKRIVSASQTASNTALPQAPAVQVPVPQPPAIDRSITTPSSITSTTPSSGAIVFKDDDYDDDDEEGSAIPAKSGATVTNSNSQLVKQLPTGLQRDSSLTARISGDPEKSSQGSVQPAIAFKPIDKPTETRFLTGGLRDYEVYRFNNTIISTGDAKVFKYFWKIEHFTKRLQAASVRNGATFSSAVFVISGLNLRLHARTVERAGGDLLTVQLEQLSAWDDELRKTPNVILASGAMYGQMETKKFFRHKIIILNQDMPFSDMISTDLTNTNAKFEAKLSELTAEPYLKDDKLLIKVIIFL
uniref:Putative secreted protein n=1 Tax=Anopheles triannulatus TaxID=58253 RepID=A0A2M4ASA0_9DIPT